MYVIEYIIHVNLCLLGTITMYISLTNVNYFIY